MSVRCSDGVFTEEIIDGVINVLKGDGVSHYGGLPSNWWKETEDSDEAYLNTLEHGDLSDYPMDESIDEFLPAIFVRSQGNVLTNRSGINGVFTAREYVRVIHVRRRDQCFDGDGNKSTNLTRARSRYAKIIHKALFNDPARKLATISNTGVRTPTTLTSADDAGAQIITVLYNGLDYGFDSESRYSTDDVKLIRIMPKNYIVLAFDMSVEFFYGGNA